MARSKQKWTSEEEEALSAGVEKHGLGRWKTILNDSQFASSLANRTNVDLKDKWRNMSGNDGGSSSRRNARTPRSSMDTRKTPSRHKAMTSEAPSSIEDPNGATISTMMGNGADISEQEERIEPASAEPLPRETEVDAAMVAAYRVSLAENMNAELIKACKEEAEIATVLDDTVVMLELAKDIYNRCSRDGVVYLAP